MPGKFDGSCYQIGTSLAPSFQFHFHGSITDGLIGEKGVRWGEYQSISEVPENGLISDIGLGYQSGVAQQ